MTCGSHYNVAFTTDVFIDVLKCERSPKLRCSKEAIFSHWSNGTREENLSSVETISLKPVQPDVQEGPVKNTFIVNLLWQGSRFSLQLMMDWALQGAPLLLLSTDHCLGSFLQWLKCFMSTWEVQPPKGNHAEKAPRLLTRPVWIILGASLFKGCNFQ